VPCVTSVKFLETSNYPDPGFLQYPATNSRRVFRTSFADFDNNPESADRNCRHHPMPTTTPSPTPTPPNPIAEATPFVTEHYRDFFNREPDEGGLAYWTGEITACGTNQQCIAQRRIAVSKAFFFSDEFQQTGAFVIRLYKATYGRNLNFDEFLPDTHTIADGAVSTESLEANKQTFLEDWVNDDDFVQAYYLTTNAEYVDALFANIGVTPSSEARANLINGLDNETETLASALRKVIDHPPFVATEFNRSFVLMQYFGYLRRDPDQAGYDFWLSVLNETNDQDGMVGAFITSTEYRARFGTP
jgi:hypothetical protein